MIIMALDNIPDLIYVNPITQNPTALKLPHRFCFLPAR